MVHVVWLFPLPSNPQDLVYSLISILTFTPLTKPNMEPDVQKRYIDTSVLPSQYREDKDHYDKVEDNCDHKTSSFHRLLHMWDMVLHRKSNADSILLPDAFHKDTCLSICDSKRPLEHPLPDMDTIHNQGDDRLARIYVAHRKEDVHRYHHN